MSVLIKGLSDDGFHEGQQPTGLTMMRLIKRMRYEDLVALSGAFDLVRCGSSPKSERRLTANMLSEAAEGFIEIDLYKRQEAAKRAAQQAAKVAP